MSDLSWPQILAILAVNFILCVLWLRARRRDMADPRDTLMQSAVDAALRDTPMSFDTTYAKGRRHGDPVPFPRTEIPSPAGGTRGRPDGAATKFSNSGGNPSDGAARVKRLGASRPLYGGQKP